MIMRFAHVCVLVASTAVFAHGLDFLSVHDSLTNADPTEFKRLFRSGYPSMWVTPRTYPGESGATGPFHYKTYDISVGQAPYLEITFDDPNGNFFVSAYQTAYNPSIKATGYLGDEGFSGNYYPADPNYFQVKAAANSHVIVVVNEATSGGGINNQYGLTVQGFIDTNYNNPRSQSRPPWPSLASEQPDYFDASVRAETPFRRFSPGLELCRSGSICLVIF